MANSDLTIDGDVVRKRYLRTDRGQPEREWAALALLQEHAPGLAPRPIARETEPPAVVMSRVEGAPLDEVLTPLQTCAMVAAYRLLYAVPVPPDMPLRFGHPAAFIADNVDWLAEGRRDDLPEVVRQALDSAARWYADAPHSPHSSPPSPTRNGTDATRLGCSVRRPSDKNWTRPNRSRKCCTTESNSLPPD